MLDTPGFVLVVKFQAHQRVLTSFGGVTVENRVLDQAGWLFWAGLQKGSNVLRKCQNALKRDSSGIKLSVLFFTYFLNSFILLKYTPCRSKSENIVV